MGSWEKLLLLPLILVPISWSPLSAIADTPWYKTVVCCPRRCCPNWGGRDGGRPVAGVSHRNRASTHRSRLSLGYIKHGTALQHSRGPPSSMRERVPMEIHHSEVSRWYFVGS